MAQVRVRWIDAPSPATGFKIFRNDVEITDIGLGLQEYIDANAPDDSTPKYAVQSYDGVGGETTQEVEGVNMDYITTPPIGPVAPDAPTNLVAGTPTSSTIPLTWTKSTGVMTEYVAYTGGVEQQTFTGDVAAGTLTGLTAETTYNNITVRAFNGLESTDSNAVSATTAAAPVGTSPAYEDFASGNARNIQVDVTYQALSADDIIIAVHSIYGSTLDLVNGGTPLASGFNLIKTSVSGTFTKNVYWKRCAGTEGGTTDSWTSVATGTGTAVAYYRFSGCLTSGDPFEEMTFVDNFSAISNSVTHSNNISLGDNRLAVMLYCEANDSATTRVSANYTENEYNLFDMTNEMIYALNTFVLPNSTTQDGDVQYSTTPNEFAELLGFLLIPA